MVGRAAFLTAAGYASADVLYDIGDPTFLDGRYSVAQFEVRSLSLTFSIKQTYQQPFSMT